MTANNLEPFLLLCLFLILFAEPAPAQGVVKVAHDEWEASVFAGGSFLGNGAHETPVEGSGQTSSRVVGLSYGKGAQIGIRVTNNRWQHWGATLEYGFSKQPLTFTNLSDSIPSLRLGHAIHRFAYEVLYYPRNPDHRLRPFVFAGPGISLFYIRGSGKETAEARGIGLSDPWKFTMNWGGGVKYLLRNQIAASLQFSDSISRVPNYGLPETGRVVSAVYVPGFHPEGLLHNWLIGIGFIFQWDD
jgi:opacity protein-like surface antigen